MAPQLQLRESALQSAVEVKAWRNRMKNLTLAATSIVALLPLLTVGAPRASADTFLLTSCHIGGSTCDGGNVADSDAFGTVTLTQDGTSVDFSVTLNNGNRFVETGAGGGYLFDFDDALSGSTITNIATSPTTPAGGLSGFTNLASFHADGSGDWDAEVGCAVPFPGACNGGSANTMTSLTFVVTNATLAQLEILNDNGNYFVADILCGPTQNGCPAGSTGPVDAHPESVPDGGMTLMLLGGALVGVESLRRRIRA
jgi:hypothetical protein